MYSFVTGNILESHTQCLVNTVNCEGYMGKGIAYQFKKAFPKNNDDYIKACKTGELTVGKIHHFIENNKIIVNFPTKDKWREKSKISYIDKGMDTLIDFIKNKELDKNSFSYDSIENSKVSSKIAHGVFENIEMAKAEIDKLSKNNNQKTLVIKKVKDIKKSYNDYIVGLKVQTPAPEIKVVEKINTIEKIKSH